MNREEIIKQMKKELFNWTLAMIETQAEKRKGWSREVKLLKKNIKYLENQIKEIEENP